MARLLGSLLLLAVLAYGIYPYYTVYRIDVALTKPEAKVLLPYLDLPAIRAGYKGRFGGAVDGFVPRGDSEADRALGWLAKNLQQLGDTALDQVITLDWVRDQLQDAAARGTVQRPANFISGIDFAFFESWNRFVIRLGELGQDTTHVVLTLEGTEWKVTDVIR
jgi:hypothetical protein